MQGEIESGMGKEMKRGVGNRLNRGGRRGGRRSSLNDNHTRRVPCSHDLTVPSSYEADEEAWEDLTVSCFFLSTHGDVTVHSFFQCTKTMKVLLVYCGSAHIVS